MSPCFTCAVLSYDEEADRFAITVAEDAGPEDVPMLMTAFVERGERTIGDEWARRWVAERVVPASRQNLGAILREAGLDDYDELALLVWGDGRCSQDDFEIEEFELPKNSTDVTYAFLDTTDAVRADAAQNRKVEVARAFREARLAAGVSQAELARRTGIQQAAISRFEQGKSNPTLETLADLAEGIGLSLKVRFE